MALVNQGGSERIKTMPGKLPDPMKYLQKIAEFGPRPTCGEKEKEAAHYAKNQMESMGLEVSEERFFCNPSMFRPHMLVFLFVVAMGVLPLLFQHYSFGFFLAALGCFYSRKLYTDLLHNKPISFMKFLPQKPCQNVLGIIKPKKEIKNRIVLLSHLDSALCSPIFGEKMVKSLRSNIIIDRVLFALLGFLYLGGAFFHSMWFYYGALLLSLYVLGSLVILLYSELFSPISPGVNDNGSGVAAVLSMAEYLQKNPLENSEVWCVCLGAEETGALGSKALWEEHADQLMDSTIINIDSVALGTLRYVTTEGFTEEYNCDQEMISFLEELEKECPHLALKPFPFKGWGGFTDCTHLLQKGCRAITLVSTEESGFIKNWHTLRDTLDGIQKDTYGNLMETVDYLVHRLDQSKHS